MFFKIGILKSFAIFTGKNCVEVFFRSRLQHRCFLTAFLNNNSGGCSFIKWLLKALTFWVFFFRIYGYKSRLRMKETRRKLSYLLSPRIKYVGTMQMRFNSFQWRLNKGFDLSLIASIGADNYCFACGRIFEEMSNSFWQKI